MTNPKKLPRKKPTLSAEEMIEMRKNGATFRAIGDAAGIGPMRVSQIVRATAPTLGNRMPRKKTDKEFIGADIDTAVKEALREHVQVNGSSISAFVSEAVEEKLKALGVEIIRAPINRGERLPFEGTN